MSQKNLVSQKKFGVPNNLGSQKNFSPIKFELPKYFGVQKNLGLKRVMGPKTRPSSDSEAATMYKLKGQSSNIRTGLNMRTGPSS